MTPALTDEALMMQVQVGSRLALSTLLGRHASRLSRLLERLVKDRALAADLLQTTFLCVLQGNDRHHPGRPVKPWLSAVARNVARDSMRRARVGTRVMRLHFAAGREEPSPTDPLLRARIREAFDHLPPKQRECVELHRVEGYSFDEMSEQLLISPVAARVRAHRGYVNLRATLADMKEFV